MRKFKLINLMLALFASVVILSCGVNSSDNKPMYNAWGFISKIDKTNYQIQTDFGKILFAPNVNADEGVFKPGDRVYIEFYQDNAPLDFNLPSGFDNYDFFINFIRIFKVNYSNIVEVTEENEESLGKDFIGINGNDVSNTILNLSVYFKSKKNDKSKITLCYDPKLQEEGSNVIVLNLRRKTLEGDDNTEAEYGMLESFEIRDLTKWGNVDSDGYIEFKVVANVSSEYEKSSTTIMRVKLPKE